MYHRTISNHGWVTFIQAALTAFLSMRFNSSLVADFRDCLEGKRLDFLHVWTPLNRLSRRWTQKDRGKIDANPMKAPRQGRACLRQPSGFDPCLMFVYVPSVLVFD